MSRGFGTIRRELKTEVVMSVSLFWFCARGLLQLCCCLRCFIYALYSARFCGMIAIRPDSEAAPSFFSTSLFLSLSLSPSFFTTLSGWFYCKHPSRYNRCVAVHARLPRECIIITSTLFYVFPLSRHKPQQTHTQIQLYFLHYLFPSSDARRHIKLSTNKSTTGT